MWFRWDSIDREKLEGMGCAVRNMKIVKNINVN